jgi:branched-chain amino acid transport system permease protein
MNVPGRNLADRAGDRARQADNRRVEIVGGMRQRWKAQPKAVRILVGIAFVVLLYTLPLLNPPIITTTDSDFATVLFDVSIFVLVAVGLNIVIGLAGLLDLGYIGFFATGAYTVAVFGSPESNVHTKFPWLICVPIAIALTMVTGVLLGGPTLRLRGDYLALVTLGFGELAKEIADNSGEKGLLRGQRGISSVPVPPGHHSDGTPLFNLADGKPYYWLALSVIIVCMVGVIRLERSRVGRAWVAIREDEDAAELMGVPAFRFKLWAFAMGACLGGLSGALFAGHQGFINSDSFQLQLSMLYVAAVVLGGAGNLLGVTLGAIIVAYLPERFRGFSEYRFMVFGLVLIVVMIFRPQGIVPSRRRQVELAVRQEEVEVGA